MTGEPWYLEPYDYYGPLYEPPLQGPRELSWVREARMPVERAWRPGQRPRPYGSERARVEASEITSRWPDMPAWMREAIEDAVAWADGPSPLRWRYERTLDALASCWHYARCVEWGCDGLSDDGIARQYDMAACADAIACLIRRVLRAAR